MALRTAFKFFFFTALLFVSVQAYSQTEVLNDVYITNDEQNAIKILVTNNNFKDFTDHIAYSANSHRGTWQVLLNDDKVDLIGLNHIFNSAGAMGETEHSRQEGYCDVFYSYIQNDTAYIKADNNLMWIALSIMPKSLP